MGSDYDNSAFGMLDPEQIEKIDKILSDFVSAANVNCVMMIDMAGNIISRQDNGNCHHDLYSLAALASANFAAVDTMAKIVGEQEFSLLFHKGENENIHFSKVSDDYLLISIFSKEVTLGLLRLKVGDAINKINSLQ